MAKATFNGTVVAESDATVVVEGNHYFPPDSVKADVLSATDRTSRCFWKGDAEYFDLTVDGETAANAVWHYPEPLEGAAEIKDHVAFYQPPVEVAA